MNARNKGYTITDYALIMYQAFITFNSYKLIRNLTDDIIVSWIFPTIHIPAHDLSTE